MRENSKKRQETKCSDVRQITQDGPIRLARNSRLPCRVRRQQAKHIPRQPSGVVAAYPPNEVGAPSFCPATAVFAPCSSHTTLACLYSIRPAEEGMPMNSRRTISQSGYSRGQWVDVPPEPPPHPTEQYLVARVRSWLSKLAPLTTVRPRLSGLASFTSVWSPLTALTPRTFAQYLIAFFIGVVAAVAWQSYRGGTKEETVAASQASLDSVRQSVDRLAAEVMKIRAVEQDILEKISAPPPQPVATPPQPVATPTRNPSQRPSSVR